MCRINQRTDGLSEQTDSAMKPNSTSPDHRLIWNRSCPVLTWAHSNRTCACENNKNVNFHIHSFSYLSLPFYFHCVELNNKPCNNLPPKARQALSMIKLYGLSTHQGEVIPQLNRGTWNFPWFSRQGSASLKALWSTGVPCSTLHIANP